jgi:hypothetical protein
MKSSFLLILLLGVASQTSMVLAQSAGTFTATGNMTTARAAHTATLLPSGKVLIAGGAQYVSVGPTLVLASAELYDPITSTFTATGNMTTPRQQHTATLLADGRVLIAGGSQEHPGQTVDLASAEIYDPSTGTFTATGDLSTAQHWLGATLLGDGKILVAGGIPGAFPTPAPAQLYDPGTGMFGAAGAYAMAGDRSSSENGPAKATLLPDGRALVLGLETAELYDPGAGLFNATGVVAVNNDDYTAIQQSATLLLNGKVLIVHGLDGMNGMIGTAEVYDPSTGTTTATGNMTTARQIYTDTLLPDGAVLIAGHPYLPSAELYDPGAGTFSATGNMTVPRDFHSATLLPDGTVLFAGGTVSDSHSVSSTTSSAELYRPVSLAPAPSLLSLSGDGRGQGAIQHGDTYQVVSSSNPAVAGEILAIYCTGLADGSVIPPQVAIGGRLAEIQFFGNTPGYAGLNQVNVQVPGGVVPGPAVPVRLSYLGRPSNEVTIGVR